MLQIEEPTAPEPGEEIAPRRGLASWGRRRRLTALAAVTYVLLRVESVLASPAFHTPDTASYTSGQATRPPLGSFLISTFGTTGYELLSAVVSTAGFVALAVAMWDPARRRWSLGIATFLGIVSMLPTFHVYEHWLIPDSFLVGVCCLALALAWRPHGPRWRPVALVALLVLATLAKEIGFSLALLIAFVAAIRWSWRTALVAVALTGVLFATVVSPASDRPGRVLAQEPLDTPLTMNRFRIIAASLAWWSIDDRLLEVNHRAAECGMTLEQFTKETFGLTNLVVHFRHCPELWQATDALSQFDVLLIHAEHPEFIDEGVRRGFAPRMQAMAEWSRYRWSSPGWFRVDRVLAGLLSTVSLAAVVLSLVRRRGRRLALVVLAANGLALAAILVDPSGQDRHAYPFRVVALVVALMALTDAFAPRALPVTEGAAGTRPDTLQD